GHRGGRSTARSQLLRRGYDGTDVTAAPGTDTNVLGADVLDPASDRAAAGATTRPFSSADLIRSELSKWKTASALSSESRAAPALASWVWTAPRECSPTSGLTFPSRPLFVPTSAAVLSRAAASTRRFHGGCYSTYRVVIRMWRSRMCRVCSRRVRRFSSRPPK